MSEQCEKARLELQARLDAAKTQQQRNRLGQFATPPDLASDIVAHAVSMLSPALKIRFLEPGFGSGPFYSALLRQVAQSRIEAAGGYEIDGHYGEPARRLWKGTGLRLHAADFTKADPPRSEASKYNLVVCNPPYVRHHHLSHTKKQELRAAVARYLDFEMNGLSGLYTYFMLLSQAWMAKDGVGAWLIPSEFMNVNYGRKVKEFLVKKVTLHRIHRFDPDESQFGDALVSSAIVCFTNSPPPARHAAEFTFAGTLTRPKACQRINLTDLGEITKWTRLPQARSIGAENRTGYTLADFFTIKRGLATGCNPFFVLSPQEVAQWRLPMEFLKPILPSPRELDSDEILADEHGEPQIRSRRYLLSCPLRESRVKAEYPDLWRYLKRGMDDGIPDRYLCRHRKPWYCQETRPPSPYLCTYMGRPTQKSQSPFRFILNHSNATAANVYLMLYPTPYLVATLKDDPTLHRQVWKALASITSKLLTSEGRVYGGGLHKLEPKELASVPADVVLRALPNRRELLRQKPLFL